MKAQMKAVMASAVVIVLALAAVSGVTYSWWSDTEDAEIQIQTGMLDVSVSNFGYSNEGDGELSVEEGSTTGNSKAINLNVLNAAPGDVYTAEYDVEFKSTVRAKYIVDAESNVDWISIELTSDGSISDMSDWGTLPSSTSNNDYKYYLYGKITVTFTLSEDTPMNSKGTVVINNRITQSANDEQYWNGLSAPEFPDSSVDEDDKTLKIGNAAELALFRDNVNGGEEYTGWTVILTSNINLNDVEWTPIGNSSNYFRGSFDGDNYTISNLNVDVEDNAGLFGKVGAPGNVAGEIRNLKIDHADINGRTGVGSLAGSMVAKVTNVEVSNSNVIGNHFVGGIIGHNYSAVSGCSASNVVVSAIPIDDDANGDKVGGIIGYIEGGKIDNCLAEDVEISGYRNLGGIAGCSNNSISNCTVENASITHYRSPSFNGDSVQNKSGAIAGTRLTWTGENNALTGEITTDDDAVMESAISCGVTNVILLAGEYDIDSAGGKNLTITGMEGTIVNVVKIGAGGENVDYGLDGSTVIFNKVTFKTNSSTYIGYARLNATYNDCIFNGTYTLYGDSIFNNCTFNVSGDVYNIWTWGAPEATFNNCIFNSSGKALLLYTDGQVSGNHKITVNNCTFNDDVTLSAKKAAIEIGAYRENTYELIVTNTTVNGYEINDEGISTETTLWGNKNSMGTDKLNVIVDGVDVY